MNKPGRVGDGRIATSAKSKRALLKTPGSQHKKDDDIDEESRPGFMEKKYQEDNN